jgi:hypothetical protein
MPKKQIYKAPAFTLFVLSVLSSKRVSCISSNVCLKVKNAYITPPLFLKSKKLNTLKKIKKKSKYYRFSL